jgi:hypothetical protein
VMDIATLHPNLASNMWHDKLQDLYAMFSDEDDGNCRLRRPWSKFPSENSANSSNSRQPMIYVRQSHAKT